MAGECLNSLRPSDAYMCHWYKHHWFISWLVAWTAASHYLNQCWNIVNWILRNKLQWNFNRNSNIFIGENTFENVVCEMTVILSRPQCVNMESPNRCITDIDKCLKLKNRVTFPSKRISRSTPARWSILENTFQTTDRLWVWHGGELIWSGICTIS